MLTDCGTGLLHSTMSAVLAKSDVLIVVASGSIDGARSASATLDWLEAHGHEDLVRNSIAVVNAVRSRSGKVDMQKVVDHFARRCRAVRVVSCAAAVAASPIVNINVSVCVFMAIS